MKRPPEKFIREYKAFRERFDWAVRGVEDGDLVQTQLTYADNLTFLDRWQGRVGVPELEKALAHLRPRIENIGRLLEARYLEALGDLLEKRHSVLIEPHMFELAVNYIRMMSLAPDTLRPGLEKIFRDHRGYDFDPERYYRESEGALDRYTAEYNQAFACMAADWRERFDAETRERLARAEITEINTWKAENAASLAALEALAQAAAAMDGPFP